MVVGKRTSESDLSACPPPVLKYQREQSQTETSYDIQRWRGWGIKRVKRAVEGRGEHFCGGERDTWQETLKGKTDNCCREDAERKRRKEN